MKKVSRNTIVLLGLAAVVGVMLGITSQAKSIYDMFCGATGLYGTTQTTSVAPSATKERTVKVILDGNVDGGLPWEFAPDEKSVTVKLGEVKVVKYHAKNLSNKTVVGTAVHNVQPDKAGLYFNKIQCFCFTKQVLKPGERIELPVQFFIDASMADDKNEDDVANITLSYTFYLAKDQGKAASAKTAASAVNEKITTSSQKD